VVLQLSLVHGLLSLQLTLTPPPQTPVALHFSPVVHALPSLHAAPVVGTCWQGLAAFAGLQLSAVHGLLSSQFKAALPWHTPAALQTSPVVHALPSLQAVPVSGVNTHPVAGLQLSCVQALLSLHTTAAPGVHAPKPSQ
jgi:hypothetical protein